MLITFHIFFTSTSSMKLSTLQLFETLIRYRITWNWDEVNSSVAFHPDAYSYCSPVHTQLQICWLFFTDVTLRGIALLDSMNDRRTMQIEITQQEHFDNSLLLDHWKNSSGRASNSNIVSGFRVTHESSAGCSLVPLRKSTDYSQRNQRWPLTEHLFNWGPDCIASLSVYLSTE